MASFFGNVSSQDVYGPSMRNLYKTKGLAPPIGASPGELRLWLKQNGLLDGGNSNKRPVMQKTAPQRIGQAGRRVNAARVGCHQSTAVAAGARDDNSRRSQWSAVLASRRRPQQGRQT